MPRWNPRWGASTGRRTNWESYRRSRHTAASTGRVRFDACQPFALFTWPVCGRRSFHQIQRGNESQQAMRSAGSSSTSSERGLCGAATTHDAWYDGTTLLEPPTLGKRRPPPMELEKEARQSDYKIY